ncbi:DNA-binding SARP family transcriptional activator [Nonomuraea polychroma]|uniref:DNA-binding SARP family transcriptional activator n=1 Tax=Nonomuraea polychroma TaxID=46176 RepID=A0A438LZN2_9ACTN|nr:BTAD domain-containing putative transcriptional regulator [Nonomuraea polychroma]RVX38990.1 DNA-binding SARP family transcriptional activator [Nonomuraea polychroma]
MGPKVTFRCFSSFIVEVGGAPVDLSQVRRRARTLLRLLAVHTGRPVHREQVIEALWPDAGPATAIRSLHVAVSTLRRLLTEHTGHGMVGRSGEAYLLDLPAGAACDVQLFRVSVAAAERARRMGDPDARIPALRAAVAAYTGDLLPEDGPAEWVLHERSILRYQAARSAAELAAAELSRGCGDEAVAAATRCLEIDEYYDDGWRLLIEANRERGDVMGVARARRRYNEALAALEDPYEA